MNHKNSWTYKCKKFVMGLFTFIIFYVFVLISYEVFTGKENTAVSIELIGALILIIPILGWLLKFLLHHEREKNKYEKKSNKTHLPERRHNAKN